MLLKVTFSFLVIKTNAHIEGKYLSSENKGRRVSATVGTNMLETNVTTGIHCWAARSVVGFVSCCASELEYVENLACATPCQTLFLTMSTNGTFSTTLGEDGVTPMLRRWVNLLGSEVQRVSQSHYCTNCQRRMAVLPAYLQRRQWAEGEAGTMDEAHGCPLPQPSNWSIFPSGSFLDESWSNPFSDIFP